MTHRRKYTLAIAAVLVVAVGVWQWVQKSRAQVVEVQIGPVARQDLAAVVTASGEIRPRHYVNINSESFGKIVAIEVQEGGRVRKGQVLLRMEAVQPEAEVDAQRAYGRWVEAEVEAQAAKLKSAQAELQRARADFQRAQLNWERAQGLHADQLISQQDYDASKAEFESGKAAVESAQAHLLEVQAGLRQARASIEQARAQLARASDVLGKTIYTSPIDGIVTNLPVHVGERMVPGIQNAPGSFLMTVADMSEVTAEVKVDETDIVNVRLAQPVEVTIDAYPNRTFPGTVREIGTTAIVRSTGQSTAQLTTGTQEAKDFKVVITLLDPPEGVRPGLSTTARVTTATRSKVVTIPIQSLTIRRKADIEAAENASKGDRAQAAERLTANPGNKEELQGVFVVENGQARFRPVKTGITGVTDIEVTEGLKEGEQIVIGSYKVLRELKHLARVRKEKEPGKS